MHHNIYMWIRIRKRLENNMLIIILVCVFVRVYLRIHSINRIINPVKSNINGTTETNKRPLTPSLPFSPTILSLSFLSIFLIQTFYFKAKSSQHIHSREKTTQKQNEINFGFCCCWFLSSFWSFNAKRTHTT